METSKEQLADDSRYASIASGFHATVCNAAGNPVLALAANSIQSIWSVRVTTVLFSPEDRPLVFQQHEADHSRDREARRQARRAAHA